MDLILVIVILVLSWVVGVFGFAQIIGSIQTRQRGYLFTILFWAAILAGCYVLVRTFLPKQLRAWYIGTGAALLATLFSGRIE